MIKVFEDFFDNDFGNDFNNSIIDNTNELNPSDNDYENYETTISLFMDVSGAVKKKSIIRIIDFCISLMSYDIRDFKKISDPFISDIEGNSISINDILYLNGPFKITFGVDLVINNQLNFYNICKNILLFDTKDSFLKISSLKITSPKIRNDFNNNNIELNPVDFMLNRREHSVIKRFKNIYSALCPKSKPFDYDQLKACMNLDTCYQMTRLSISDYSSGKMIECKLKNKECLLSKFSTLLTKNTFSDYLSIFFLEPDLIEMRKSPFRKSTSEDGTFSQIAEQLLAKKKTKVYPHLYVNVRGKKIKFISVFCFDKTVTAKDSYGISYTYSFFLRSIDQETSIYFSKTRFNEWFKEAMKPFKILGENVDDIYNQLKQYIDKLPQTHK